MRSNHSIGFDVASLLTPVGLTRQSIGPAMSVRLAGAAGSSSSDMIATAASAATQGWQIAIRCDPGPDRVEELDEVLDVLVEPEPAGRQRHVARVVPVGDVDVVVGEHRAHGVAQQRGEMAGHRRDEEHARLCGRDVLPEVQQGCERRRVRDLFADRDVRSPIVARYGCRTPGADA